MRRLFSLSWLALAALTLLVAGCGAADDAVDDATNAVDEVVDEAEEAVDDATGDADADADADTASDADADADAGSGEPIKIGTLTSLNGPFTPWGIQVRDGMQLAVDEINADGGVDGRLLELIVYDDQSNGEEAIKGIERLIEDGVVAIGGPISSDVGLATSTIAEELEVPLFLAKAGSDAILTTDSRYTFRTCIPAAPMVAEPIVQYAQAEGMTKVGAIIADYGWGQSIKAAMEDSFADAEGIELQIEVAPVGEQDFTTYLRKLQEFDPALIVATGHPPGSGAITAQSAELGLDVPITGAYSPLAGVMNGVGDAGIGRYADFGCADYDSASYQELAARFVANTDNVFMEDDGVSGYGVVTMVADAIANVGDDPADIAAFLHGASYDLPGYAFKMAWTEWGEMANAAPQFVVIGEGPAPDGLNESGTWWPTTLIKPDPLTPYEP